MNTYEQFYAEGFPTTWDNTMRSTGRTCPRKFQYFMRGYDYALRPAYFVWGSAWQEILIKWYDDPRRLAEPGSKELQELIYEALGCGFAYWDSTGVESKGDNNRRAMEFVWINYCNTYPTEPFEIMPLGSEAGWEYPIEGTPYFMGGSLDHYIAWEPYGYLILENKTAGEYLSTSYMNQWEMAPQIKGYIWYLTQLHGKDCYGALVNCVTKKIPGPRSNWTTPRCSRVLVQQSSFQLEEFINEVLFDVANLKACFDGDWWPKAADGRECSGGPGKAPCLFRPICVTDADFRTVDPTMYENITVRGEKWEPWRRKGEQ